MSQKNSMFVKSKQIAGSYTRKLFIAFHELQSFYFNFPTGLTDLFFV